jgi:hypothetical protein
MIPSGAPVGSDGASSGLRVRSYVLTGGRTRGGADLPFEALIQVTADGRASLPRLSLERRDIIAQCVGAISVAEISAHLHLPLGVVRVLVGDMVEEGLLLASAPDTSRTGDRPDRQLLERVLDGLQSL